LTSPSETAAVSGGIAAAYFDGRSAVRQDVVVSVMAGELHVTGDAIVRSSPLAAIEITLPLGTAPRLIRFPDGAFCSVEQQVGFEALLAANGVTPPRVTQWEDSSRWIAVAVVVFMAVLVAGYRYGLPLAAGVAAYRVPPGVVDLISEQTLATFDRTIFDDSTVPDVRQARIRSRFAALRLPDGESVDAYRMLFRDSPLLGANAMALPSGTLIVTDALVALTEDDADVVAVLAHEAGHVARRHSMRQLFQNSVVGLAVTWFIGDVSVLAAAAPTALLQAKYSRDFEREADAFALGVLDANRIPRDHFARMLERLEKAAGGSSRTRPSDRISGYISSHPVTAERLEMVRRR
jgi:Zn-dependent protease with chaperone function